MIWLERIQTAMKRRMLKMAIFLEIYRVARDNYFHPGRVNLGEIGEIIIN